MGRNLLFIILTLFLLQLSVTAQQRFFDFPQGTTSENFSPTTIILKLRPVDDLSIRRRSVSDDSKILKLNDLTTKTETKSYLPILQTIPNNGNIRRGTSSLKSIYKLTLSEGADLQNEINKLLQFENVIYAEPVYMEQPLFVPNDPLSADNQNHLEVVRAYDAWNIHRGSSNVSIAVIDTGIDLDHPDLVENFLVNSSDPVNGIDDDSDGIIDNYIGYDFADRDSDVTADRSAHGTLVAGLSSADTDNNLGIAGTGFHSKLVPYKIFRSSDGFSNGSYEAVLFAAQKGHQVINLSWGAPNFYSQFNQDVINEAVLNYDAVVVAAAGNTPTYVDFYPASYDNVLSVSANNDNDTKSGFSSYSFNVDISAPGSRNYTTRSNGSYGFTGGGTSFASPIVAGAAAVLRGAFPEWTAQQVIEQLRVSSDDVYAEGSNNDFFGQLGKGRLNMFNALNDTSYKSIRLTSFSYDNGFGEYAFYNDTLDISTEFQNFLQPTENATVTVSTSSPYVTMLSGGAELGSLATLESTNHDDAFEIILNEETPPNTVIDLRLDYSDNTYSDWQFRRITTSPDFFNIGTDRMLMTVSGNGNLGYQEDVKTNGVGLVLDGLTMIDQMGIIIDADGNIIDNAPTDFLNQSRNHDFVTEKNLRLFNNSTADLFVLSSLNDSNAGAQKTGIVIEQKSLTWKNAADGNYVIVEYRVSNVSGSDITDLKLAMFSDWKMTVDDLNTVTWDEDKRLGYGSYLDSQFGGIALLTEQDPIFYAIDKDNVNGNAPDLGTVFSKSEKKNFIESGIGKTAAGLSGGNDVAQLSGGEIGELLNGDSKKIAFAVLAGNSLSEIESALDQARLRYDDFLNNPPLSAIDTFCLDKSATINLAAGSNFDFYSDPLGDDLIFSGNDFVTGILDKDTTFYVQNTDGAFKSDIRSVRIKTNELEPNVIFEDTLFLGDNPNNLVNFKDQTFKSIKWQWDFDNGAGSTASSPSIQFSEVGDYQVSVIIDDAFGCQSEYSQMLRVRERGPEPVFDDIIICQNQSASISSIANQNLRIYNSFDGVEPIAETYEFITGQINKDTTFFISNVDAQFESRRVAVAVNIIDLQPAFQIVPDTSNLGTKSSVQLINQTLNYNSAVWKINGNTIDEAHPFIDLLSLDELDVELTVTNDQGCSNTLTQAVVPTISQVPSVSETIVCPGNEAIIEPSGGEYFFFYSDQALSNLLHKGQSFEPQDIVSDTVFYVTGFDDLLESTSVEAHVDIVPFEVDFSISLVSSNDESTLIALQDLSEGSVSWQWYLNDEFVESIENPVLTINSPEAVIKLIATNEEGCTIENTRTLEREVVTGISEIEVADISVYPNPADDQLQITHSILGATTNYRLIDLTGRVTISGSFSNGSYRLNIEDLRSGIYSLQIEVGQYTTTKRIVVR